MCDVIEVVLPGSMEGDADKAIAALRDATTSWWIEDTLAAVKALRLAAQWHYGGDAWRRLSEAADRIELRLKQGQPWKRTLRNALADVGPLLRAVAGRDD